MIPSRFAIEMINRGWILRNENSWWKPNPMISSAKDRFTVDFEKVYFFVKSNKYDFRQQFVPLSPNTDMEYRKQLRANKRYNVKDPYKNNMPFAYHGKATKKYKGTRAQNPSDVKRRAMKSLVKQGGKRNMRTTWKIKTESCKLAHVATFPPRLVETPIKAGCPIGGIVLDPFLGIGTTILTAQWLDRVGLGFEISPDFAELIPSRLKQIPKLSDSKAKHPKQRTLAEY